MQLTHLFVYLKKYQSTLWLAIIIIPETKIYDNCYDLLGPNDYEETLDSRTLEDVTSTTETWHLTCSIINRNNRLSCSFIGRERLLNTPLITERFTKLSAFSGSCLRTTSSRVPSPLGETDHLWAQTSI